MPTVAVDVDYLVVGAGAAGLAFTDALIDHADVRVAIVDRRRAAGGHWLDDYSFVRLHQASAFYGVASTPLGGGRVQTSGPEAGLHERATGAEVCDYFAAVLERLVATGRVTFQGGCDYVGDRRFVADESGQSYEVPERCRIVDASYLSPAIPARTPPPFVVDAGARVVPVNELVRLGDVPRQIVIVGSGKTATDAIVWLVEHDVDPDVICWVRPRDPWMLNRAVVQPDPAVFVNMAADIMSCAAASDSIDDLFLRLEDAGVMLRVDRAVTPTMAKSPTLAQWELDRLRRIERVVRHGHVRAVGSSRLVLDDGEVALDPAAVVVHCAADGLRRPSIVPIWQPDAIRPQPVRAGFPCLAAALAGYVEATRAADDDKNRICPANSFSNAPADWCAMQVRGSRATAAFGAEPDIRAWLDGVALNPVRTPPDDAGRAALAAASERLAAAAGDGISRLAYFAGSELA
ncbi:MAG TPA: NAD(P)-binding protein [Mycobacteriales bacterium]|nr:NAD(P)-binding protein [Mycobacteriales bacterium]